MNILVTAGGTTEYIDDVRVLTNISTGKLGATIANALMNANGKHRLHYVCTKTSAGPTTYEYPGSLDYHVITDVSSLMEKMKELVPQVDVVIHAMAVSDFGFRRDGAVKLKSNDPKAFADYIRDHIQTNPKVISYIKTWNPKCKLIGFKFEVGKDYGQLADLACESLMRNNCDVVIANDKEEMARRKEHIAYWITHETYRIRSLKKQNSLPYSEACNLVESVMLKGKKAIAEKIVEYVDSLEQDPSGKPRWF